MTATLTHKKPPPGDVPRRRLVRRMGAAVLRRLLQFAVEDDLRPSSGIVGGLLGRFLAKDHGLDALADLGLNLGHARAVVAELGRLLAFEEAGG